MLVQSNGNENQMKMFTIIAIIQHCTKGYTKFNETRQNKIIKIVKEEIIFTDNMTVNISGKPKKMK